MSIDVPSSGGASEPPTAAGPALHLLYGGTFDPIHEGHLAVARVALTRSGARRLDFVPAADPPHRAAPGAGFDDRLALIEAALAAEPDPPLGSWGIDPREGRRAGPSFTVDTLREWRREHGAQAPLGFVLGADAFLSLPGWHNWRMLFDLAHLLVAGRPGVAFVCPDRRFSDGPLPEALTAVTTGRWTTDPGSLSTSPAGRLLELELLLRPENATAVRRDLAVGRVAEGLPPAVAALIEARRLYR